LILVMAILHSTTMVGTNPETFDEWWSVAKFF
jgi:hypothetical protein